VKGIAFERFLGRTFRGEIGQFFTPRQIVKFMVEMVQPRFDETICDPASGSGGFLIRFFANVREQLLAEADKACAKYKAEIEGTKSSAKKKAESLRRKYDQLQRDLDPKVPNSSMWQLSNRCIYGTDANDRMARTSKMNMIMHGDGHGGVHHWNGFLNVNGIFDGRFDIILTNPPFGSHVESSALVELPEGAEWEESKRVYTREYGDVYRDAVARVEAAKGKPIASLFELPRRGGEERVAGKAGKIKTEILFIERCLALLRPGGRLGIVLPEGIFNNPSLGYVREFCENRAFIRAVVSLPQETFLSSGASVKASLLFLQKFTAKEQAEFDRKHAKAHKEIEAKYAPEIAKETSRLQGLMAAMKASRDMIFDQFDGWKRELRDYERTMADTIASETRALLKERFPYPTKPRKSASRQRESRIKTSWSRTTIFHRE
jgi:type I restriction enzyme M protein